MLRREDVVKTDYRNRYSFASMMMKPFKAINNAHASLSKKCASRHDATIGLCNSKRGTPDKIVSIPSTKRIPGKLCLCATVSYATPPSRQEANPDLSRPCRQFLHDPSLSWVDSYGHLKALARWTLEACHRTREFKKCIIETGAGRMHEMLRD